MRAQETLFVGIFVLVADDQLVSSSASLELSFTRPTRQVYGFVAPTLARDRHRRRRYLSNEGHSQRSSSGTSTTIVVDHQKIPRFLLTSSHADRTESNCVAKETVDADKNRYAHVHEGTHVKNTEDPFSRCQLFADASPNHNNQASPCSTSAQPALSSNQLVLATQAAGIVAIALAFWVSVPSDAAAAAASGVDLSLAAPPVDVGAVFAKAGKASLGGGTSGAAAAVVQVLSLMWLRTTMNFQYKNGGSTQEALQTLWAEGGIPRLYRGVSFALVQGPLSRIPLASTWLQLAWPICWRVGVLYAVRWGTLLLYSQSTLGSRGGASKFSMPLHSIGANTILRTHETCSGGIDTAWEQLRKVRLVYGDQHIEKGHVMPRFGDTAANVGVLALLEAFEETKGLPLPVKSAAGSIAAGLWRIWLTPIDAYKTTLQVSGADGVSILADKVAANGPSVLFEGALASATATFVGHYPWYFTYNALGAWLPMAPPGETLLKLGRQAFLGLCSSCVSDCCSNSVRVVKTTKQTSPVPIDYPQALKQVVDEDGVSGLFFRGLQTRLLVNALQGALFAVAWKYFEGVLKTGL